MRATTGGVLDDLVRSLGQLLDAVLSGSAVRPADHGGVVLDIELGGFRWIAVQQHPCPDAVSLSPRESEIARMVAAGLTNRAIATVLDISPWTVGTYLRRIFVKLDVNSRAAMTAAVAQRRAADPVPPVAPRRDVDA
ncbi:helix-turn-helix transcriptional regulator [Blastococcus sp. SYSU DS0669]